MKTIIIYCISCWVLLSVVFFLIWHFNKDLESKLYHIVIQFLTLGIAFNSLIISLNNYSHYHKVAKDMIIPKLQVKPIDIKEEKYTTTIVIDIINYSDYIAKNIFVDIKFNDKPWKRELTKAEWKDTDKLIRFDIDDKNLKEMLENFYNHPTWEELQPGKSIKLYLADENKDFLLKQKVFFSNGKGVNIPIPPTETSGYRRSQDWQNDLKKLENRQPIKVLIRTVWENEIGKIFDRVVEYKLICTKIGTGRSYTFIPSGVLIEDI